MPTNTGCIKRIAVGIVFITLFTTATVNSLYANTVQPSGGGGGGGGTTITSGAGDFGSATAQSGAVLTGVVTTLHPPITAVGSSGAYTILSTDVIISCNAGGNTMSLPSATGSSRILTFQNPPGSGNNCTIARSGSDTIDGSALSIIMPALSNTATFSLIDFASGKWRTLYPVQGQVGQNSYFCGGNGNVCLIVGGATGSVSTGGAPIVTLSGSIASTTGAIGPSGGGVLQSYGGTAPTVTAGCNGAGSGVTGSNSAFQLTTQSSGAATTCTVSFSASGPFHAAPICVCDDASASITPPAYSIGAVSTSTIVIDFASATSAVLNCVCIGH